MTNTLETHNYKDKIINIVYDTTPENPRDWDNLGKLALFHSRYNFANEDNITIEEAKEIAESDDYISLNVFMYEHGNIALSTSPFSCPWNSGQLGIIYIRKSDLKNHGLADKSDADIENYLKNEIETYSRFLSGQVYGFEITEPCGHCGSPEFIDSCYGFYSTDDALNEAKAFIN